MNGRKNKAPRFISIEAVDQLCDFLIA